MDYCGLKAAILVALEIGNFMNFCAIICYLYNRNWLKLILIINSYSKKIIIIPNKFNLFPSQIIIFWHRINLMSRKTIS